MKSYELVHLLLLLFLLHWGQVSSLCSLDKHTAAQCHDLEDARYIDTYHLHVLRAPSSSRILTPGNFRNLTSLRHLDLSGGKIESIESGSFAKLGSLQTLNLADNQLSHLEAGAFDGLKQVHSLKLGDNAINQLPSALMSLKELRLLDLSSNPLNCNCASMKLRDALLARGVKISKKTTCAEPVSAKYSSILKPDTKMTCVFEKQDLEMQGDQPIDDGTEGSGEVEEDDALDEVEKDLDADEKEVEQPVVNQNEEETAAPPTSSEESSTEVPLTTSIELSSSEALLTTSGEVALTEVVSSTTPAAKDDITFDETEKESTTQASVDVPVKPEEEPEVSEEPERTDTENKNDDLIVPVYIPSNKTDDVVDVSSSPSAPKPERTDDIIVPYEGSGESDDDGSGAEGSGMIARMPEIDFNETNGISEDEGAQISSTSATSTSTTTTESSSWSWGIGEMISNWNPFGSSETTQALHTTEKSPEEDLKEEQFFPVTQEPPKDVTVVVKAVEEPIAPPKVVVLDEELSKQSPRTLEIPEGDRLDITNNEIEDKSLDPAFSQESKKGMGSYVVLATLLVILAALIGIAAYKGDFCRKKRKRNDVERGTELKDMQRSLLDQNAAAQPKVQVSNGNTMENVPLMNCSSAPPDEPKESQRSYDITPTAAVVTNGSSRSNNGPTIEVNDPVKPPRKSPNPEIEAPLNGLNPPMDAIDAPIRTSLHSASSDEVLNSEDYCERPPLSPGAQRVKITLQENPDSVPKTPILITRLKGGENLVKAP